MTEFRARFGMHDYEITINASSLDEAWDLATREVHQDDGRTYVLVWSVEDPRLRRGEAIFAMGEQND